jgi:hypothetical protein
MTPGSIPDGQAMNRWSDAKLKAHGYEQLGLVNVADRASISAFIAQKITEGYHCVLRRQYRGVWRRLYIKRLP